MPEEDDWTKDARYVKAALNRIEKRLEDLGDDLQAHAKEDNGNFSLLGSKIGLLELKSGFWGLLGGLVAVLVPLVVWLLTHSITATGAAK